MLKRLGSRRSATLGLDIRQNELRYVCIREAKGGLALPHLETIKIKTDDEGLLLMAETVQQSLEKNKIRPERIIVGLPRQWCFIKVLSLPVMDEEDARRALAFVLEKHLPVDPDKLAFDYRIITDRRGQDMAVLVGAARKEHVEPLLSALQSKGLEPEAIVPASLATEAIIKRCRPWILHARQSLMVEEENNSLGIDLFENGKLVSSLLLSLEEESGPEAISNLEGELFRSFSSALKGFESSKDFPWLYLGAPEGVAQQAIEALGLPSPTPIDYNALTQASKEVDIRRYHTALGLALYPHIEEPTPMNLTPARLETIPQSRRWSPRAVVLGAALATVLGLYGTIIIRDQLQVRRLENFVEALRPQVEEVNQLQREMSQLKAQLEAVESVTTNHTSPLEILRELTLVIPASAWLTETTFNGRELQIRGYAESSQELIGPLEESPLLTNIQFKGTITKRDGKEHFKISAEIE